MSGFAPERLNETILNWSRLLTVDIRDADAFVGGRVRGIAGWNRVLAPTATVRDWGLTTTQVGKIGKDCLSYIMGSDGKAAAIDPAYPAPEYAAMAKGLGLEITCVADARRNADHASAAAELAGLTGAGLYLGGAERYLVGAAAVSASAAVGIRAETVAMPRPLYSISSMVPRAVGIMAETVAVPREQIPDLETGPNRCSVRVS